MSKVIHWWVTVVLPLIDYSALRYFGVREGSSTNTCIHTFFFFLAKHRELQPRGAKLLLPIIPISIVACAFVLLWNNLCRYNCILNTLQPSHTDSNAKLKNKYSMTQLCKGPFTQAIFVALKL